MEEVIVNGMRITAGGEIENAETGEILGHGDLKNGVVFDTANATEVHTIEELGYLPIIETEEEYKEAARRQGIPVMRSTWEIIYENEHKGDNAIDAFIEKMKLKSVSTEHGHDGAMKSKYEVRPDTSFVVRFGIMEDNDGKFFPVPANVMYDDPNVEMHWVKFRMWTYDEKRKWKSECMDFNASKKALEVNVEKMNERKIRSLLLDWSFGKSGDDMKLLHCEGELSNESYSMFLNLYPSIANTIVDLMNTVLDNR